MRYYNACVYDKRDNLVRNTVLTVGEDGKIVSVESDSGFVPEDGDVDCKGYVIHPSFVDSAVIIPGKFLYADFGLDLSRYNQMSYYRYAIEAYQGSKLRAFGYNTACLSEEGTCLLKVLLDLKWPNSPAYILADDMTTAVVNEFILECAKEFFSVDKDLHTNGELDFYQLSLLRAKTNLFDFEENEIRQGLLSFQYEMLKAGVTTIRVLDTTGGEEVFKAVQRLYNAGSWILTALFYVPVYPFESEDEMWHKYERYLALSNERSYVVGVSLCMDGSIDSAQASLIKPYAISEDWRGDVLWSISKLNRITRAFVDAGIDVNINAYGDRAVSRAVFALSGSNNDYNTGLRTITHAYLMSDADIAVCNNEGIVVCVEPNLVPYMGAFYDGDVAMIGDRCYEQYPIGRIVYGGTSIISGSNYPTQADVSPIHGLFKATHRVASDSVTVWKMLSSYVETPNKLFGLWTTQGQLTPGKLANFVMLNRDIIHMNESVLMDVEVMATVVNGEIMFNRLEE